jgi:hypothetical protein
VLKIVGSTVSQIAFLTALLYYFGWARTQAIFYYFGLDPKFVEYTTADYVLRSIPAIFEPIVISLLLALLLPTLHRYLVAPALRRRALSRRVSLHLAVITRTAAFISYSFIFVNLIFQLSIGRFLGIALPMLLVATSFILIYVDLLYRMGYLHPTAQALDKISHSLTPIRTASLYLLSFVGIFWAFGLYASVAGNQDATNINRSLSDQPEVILYSTHQLAISGPGISVNAIFQSDSKYRYQYTGLRIMTTPPGKYLLIPAEWRKGQDSVFFILDDASVRVEVRSR